MADTPTLARFVLGFEEAGTGPDGLPMFAEVIQIVKSRPPYLEVTNRATEADFEDYPEPYKLFQKERAGKALSGATGYPLAMWVAMSEADLKSCLARDIHTVEDLAKLAGRGARADVPPSILEMAQRAKRMVELQKETGRHEKRLNELEGQISALREQNNEFRAQLDAANTLIGTLKARAAA